jgi:hypothetical protein
LGCFEATEDSLARSINDLVDLFHRHEAVRRQLDIFDSGLLDLEGLDVLDSLPPDRDAGRRGPHVLRGAWRADVGLLEHGEEGRGCNELEVRQRSHDDVPVLRDDINAVIGVT